MSALLSCPHCGPRPVQEFRYAAEASSARPEPDAVLDNIALSSWLYDGDNPRGLATEWWQHVAACRAWFVLRRDTMRDTTAGEPA